MILFAVIILALFIIGLKTPIAGAFSKEIVTVLKAVLPLGIVLHHLHSESVLLHEFERWGPLIVGIFFFISGYGLTYSLSKRPDYLKNFFTDKIIIKLTLPCLLAWGLDMCLNKSWADWSFMAQLTHPSGPSFFPNDWFIYGLIYCYLAFMIAGRAKSNAMRMAVLIAAPLLLVLFTSSMGYARNWWATPIAFSVGAAYCLCEERIRNRVSGKRAFAYSNILYVCVFAVLMACSALFAYNVTTVLAYSFLPLLLVNNITHINLGRLANNRIILFFSGISFEVYLIHGIIIDFLRNSFSLSGLLLVAVALGAVLVAAPLFKYVSVACQKGAAYFLPQTVQNKA